MSVVNVRIGEIFAAPANVPVTAKFVLVAGAQVVANQMGIRPGLVTLRTDATGLAQFTLAMGRYEITAPILNGASQFKVEIDVPNDSNEYEFAELIVSPTLFDPDVGGNSPNATAAVAGLVRTEETAAALPAVVPLAAPSGGGYRISGGQIQLKNLTTGLWHTVFVEGAEGFEQLSISAGGA